MLVVKDDRLARIAVAKVGNPNSTQVGFGVSDYLD